MYHEKIRNYYDEGISIWEIERRAQEARSRYLAKLLGALFRKLRSSRSLRPVLRLRTH